MMILDTFAFFLKNNLETTLLAGGEGIGLPVLAGVHEPVLRIEVVNLNGDGIPGGFAHVLHGAEDAEAAILSLTGFVAEDLDGIWVLRELLFAEGGPFHDPRHKEYKGKEGDDPDHADEAGLPVHPFAAVGALLASGGIDCLQ